MKPFPIVLIIFRFIAVCLVAYWAFVFACSFLPASNQRESPYALFQIIALFSRPLSLIYIAAGVILYFAAPLLGWLITKESTDNSDPRSIMPPEAIRDHRAAYLVIIGVLIVLGGSIILLLTR